MAYALFFAFGLVEFDFDLAEAAVGRFVRRFIGEQVLLAQILFELREGLVKLAVAFGKDGASAGRFADAFEAAFEFAHI